MDASIRDRLRQLARSGQLGRRATAAPVVVAPGPQSLAPHPPAAEQPADRVAAPARHLDPVD
jgi:hypothetical protein